MFGSDNQAPAHPAVMAAIIEANNGRAGSYGDDVWSRRALNAVKSVFETDDLDMYLVGTGGAANGLALSILCPPWGAVLALADAHVIVDEGSGPEHFTSGARLIGIGAGHARMLPEDLEAAAIRFSPANIQGPQPRAVTLSNLSENGLAYSPDELAALSDICRQQGWGLHMDGARFANAIATSGMSPADVSWRCGVEALSFGLTKNGAVCAEALIVFGKARTAAAGYLRKRAGHLFSKQRYMSAQIVAMLQNDLWLELANTANVMALSLGRIIEAAGSTLVYPVEGNEVFARLLPSHVHALNQAGIGFYPWAPAGSDIYRFVTCWQTTVDDIATVKATLLASPHALETA
jgi:threonine aldolase